MSNKETGQFSPETCALASNRSWFVYLLRAQNRALYCGITTDPRRRLAQHKSGRGARFFHSSAAQEMVYIEHCADKSAALRREIAIKQLSKQEKEELVLRHGLNTTGAD